MYFQARFNAYRGISCYFSFIGVANILIGGIELYFVAGRASRVGSCAQRTLLSLYGAVCGMMGGAICGCFAFFSLRLTEGWWSALGALVAMSAYALSLGARLVMLSLCAASLLSAGTRMCPKDAQLQGLLYAQTSIFCLELFFGSLYALGMGLDDALIEAIMHVKGKAPNDEIVGAEAKQRLLA